MAEANNPESGATPTADAVAKFLKDTRKDVAPSLPEELKRTEERNLCDIAGEIRGLALSLYQRSKDNPDNLPDDNNLWIEVGNEDVDGSGNPFLLIHDKKGIGTEYGEGDVVFEVGGSDDGLSIGGLIDQQYVDEVKGVMEDFSKDSNYKDPKGYLDELIRTEYVFEDGGSIGKKTVLPYLEDGAEYNMRYLPNSKSIPSSIESAREFELVGGLLERLRDGLKGVPQPTSV